MNKKELAAAAAEKCGMKKPEAEELLKAFTDIITEEMKKGNKVSIVGFGTFETSEHAAREGRNPRNQEIMMIPASKTLKFKPGKALKDAINE